MSKGQLDKRAVIFMIKPAARSDVYSSGRANFRLKRAARDKKEGTAISTKEGRTAAK
jgi:hypothetical protein